MFSFCVFHKVLELLSIQSVEDGTPNVLCPLDGHDLRVKQSLAAVHPPNLVAGHHEGVHLVFVWPEVRKRKRLFWMASERSFLDLTQSDSCCRMSLVEGIADKFDMQTSNHDVEKWTGRFLDAAMNRRNKIVIAAPSGGWTTT